MRNVVKGFQFSGMAVPKQHAGKINAGFNSLHTKSPPRATRLPHLAPKSANPIAKRPGKNVAIKGGYKV